MRERVFLAVNMGAARVGDTKSIIARLGLLREAQIVGTGILAGQCTLRLDREDPRVALVMDEFTASGFPPFLRVDRQWSSTEIAQAPLLRLVIATAGLLGGRSFDQSSDRSRACQTCGAGSVPRPPLVADLSKMGKKLVDRTAHDGLVIVHCDLGDALEASGVSGFELMHVCKPTGRRTPSSDYRWLQILAQLPPMRGANLRVADRCPTCGRAGHYDSLVDPVEFRYGDNQSGAADMNHTWEYFGVWRHPDGDPVGGMREIVVSQQVREIMQRLKVRGVRWEPVSVDAAGSV
jgi:hypothetical protein